MKHFKTDEIKKVALENWEMKATALRASLEGLNKGHAEKAAEIEKELEFCEYYIDLLKK